MSEERREGEEARKAQQPSGESPSPSDDTTQCAECGGSGKIDEDTNCPNCGGTGRVKAAAYS
jgi:DnaJ-class molecular chaperone